MMRWIVFVTIVVAGSSGCTVVVNSTLDMKGDGGTSSCGIDEDCDDGNPCNGRETCVSNACRDGDSSPDGTECAVPEFDGMCREAMCVPREGCGDGVLQREAPFNEECDDFANEDPNDGCTPDCQYSCHGDEECDDFFSCNGREICSIPSPEDNIRRCQPEGTLPPPGAACDLDLPSDSQMCVYPPSGEIYCCAFDDLGMPFECCRLDDSTPQRDDFICGEPPPMR